MPARTEVLHDEAMGREKALGLARGLKPLHALLPLPAGLVRILCSIIEIAVLAMLYSWENLSLSGSVAFEFIGDDHPRHLPQPFQKLTEELLCGLLVPPSLH